MPPLQIDATSPGVVSNLSMTTPRLRMLRAYMHRDPLVAPMSGLSAPGLTGLGFLLSNEQVPYPELTVSGWVGGCGPATRND